MRAAIGLTHGAGGNKDGALLRAIADRLEANGIAAHRFNLPFRASGKGPPRPADAARDREGIREVARMLRDKHKVPVYLGGHSYGGRQTSMLAAEDPDVAAGLLLMSYPLHPPGKPDQLRTAHLPSLRVPALFVSGTRDTFGTTDELTRHIAAIPAQTWLESIEGAGHGLASTARIPAVADRIVAAFLGRFGLR
jgi:predicted alpha/beta-hydrolase family hydrolase